ncbi:hypothetical protein [Flavobacterium myungsuense]|uniref:Uncharacterized protein n=1 Tax=Flavobacterium myungsuense TaxID=651823 RepID=A0ABW3J013_9FLAO
MATDTFFEIKKRVVLFAIFSFSVVSFGQDNQLSTLAKSPQINLQERTYAGVEHNNTDTTRKKSSDEKLSEEEYLIKLSKDYRTVSTANDANFLGVPNNGTMHIEMKEGYNMVGNPYPSAVNVHNFIDSNATINGTLYFLDKVNTDVAANSYATLTKIAYVSNSNKEDLSIGYFKEGDESNWFINIAQGFFVKATSDSKLIFTNSMRRITQANPDFVNSQTVTPQKGLYWLNLSKNNGVYNQMAVGYSSKGTLAEDKGIDGRNINQDFYLTSLIDGNYYSIQGRPEFTSDDIVPLSYSVDVSGTYTIAIDHTVGVFKEGSQNIYIKDKLKNKLHNLTNDSYTFFSKEGTFVDRFTIVYEPR